MLGMRRMGLKVWSELQNLDARAGRRKIDLRISRSLKTTSTTHPQPQFDQEERLLDKIVSMRQEDLPASLSNPYTTPDRKCILCEHKITPDYKNVKLLYQFVSPFTGLAYQKHVTGLCKEMHERVQTEIRKARSVGFMATYLKEPEFLKDPKICDPDRPVKPHPY